MHLCRSVVYAGVSQPLSIITTWDCSNYTGILVSFIFREMYLTVGFQMSFIKKVRAPHVHGEDDILTIENGFLSGMGFTRNLRKIQK
jgi:hypothetical protein